MVYTWYNVHFKVHISIADVAKDTSFHCFENVRVSTTRIRSKRWRYPFEKIIRFEIVAGPNREGTVRCSRCYTTFVWSILSCFSRYFDRLQRTYCVSSRFLKQFRAKCDSRCEVIGVSPNFSSRDTLIIDARHSSVKRDGDNKVSRTITLRVSSVREKREREREAARLRRRCHLLLLLPLCLLCGAVLWP